MLPGHVERYLSGLDRSYTETEHGEALRRLAEEITRRAEFRYRERLHGACLGSLLLGVAIGAAVTWLAL